MEINQINPLIRMKMENFRAEIRKDYCKQLFSLKRGINDENKKSFLQKNFEIISPEKISQKKVFKINVFFSNKRLNK